MPKKNVNLRKEHKSEKGGLTQAGRDKYNRETGSNLQAPVTAEAAKKSPAKAKRRQSFCDRFEGMKGPLKDDKGRPTRKKKALDRWDC